MSYRNHTAVTDEIVLLRFSSIKTAGIFSNRMSLKRAMEREHDPFPRPLQLGPNSVGWRLTDVRAWLDRRAAAGKSAHDSKDSTSTQSSNRTQVQIVARRESEKS